MQLSDTFSVSRIPSVSEKQLEGEEGGGETRVHLDLTAAYH